MNAELCSQIECSEKKEKGKKDRREMMKMSWLDTRICTPASQRLGQVSDNFSPKRGHVTFRKGAMRNLRFRTLKTELTVRRLYLGLLAGLWKKAVVDECSRHAKGKEKGADCKGGFRTKYK